MDDDIRRYKRTRRNQRLLLLAVANTTDELQRDREKREKRDVNTMALIELGEEEGRDGTNERVGRSSLTSLSMTTDRCAFDHLTVYSRRICSSFILSPSLRLLFFLFTSIPIYVHIDRVLGKQKFQFLCFSFYKIEGWKTKNSTHNKKDDLHTTQSSFFRFPIPLPPKKYS